MTKLFSCLCFILFFVIGVVNLYAAKSVYTIDHNYCYFTAFDVDGDNLTYRDHITLPEWGYGGIDVAVDEKTNTAFVSMESTNRVEIVRLGNMTHKSIAVTGISNLTGIVFDAKRYRLLGTYRNTNKLHILKWNPIDETLVLEDTVSLGGGIQYACDVDINDDTLYVSDYQYSGYPQSKLVYLYDLSDEFSLIETKEMDEEVVGITYNASDNCLYGGAWSESGGYLTKLDLDTDEKITKTENVPTIIGITADDNVDGRVIFTTYRYGYEGSVEIWDTDDWGTDPNSPPDPNYTDLYDSDNSDGVSIEGMAGIAFSSKSKPSGIDIVKTSDKTSCVSPVAADPNLTYTIGVSSTSNQANLWIIDYLPRDVEFISASPEDTTYGYDGETHTYTWFLSSLTGYDPNDPPADPNTYFTLNTKVTTWAEPLSTFHNIVTVESDDAYDWAYVENEVCCWGGDIIYVDKDAKEDVGYINFGGIETSWANGANNGTSWTDAYRNLKDALARAEQGCGDEIWVAEGTYSPGATTSSTFYVDDYVEIYGGFDGTETSRSERDWKKNKTILSGYIDASTNNTTLLTMGDETVVDGFIVQEAVAGISSSNNDTEVKNCTVKDNSGVGINSTTGSLDVEWCNIKDNTDQGIVNSGTLNVLHSVISGNGEEAIESQGLPSIKNCIIHENIGNGITLSSLSNGSTVYNCTIADNAGYGVHVSSTSNLPAVKNTIIYYNNSEGEQYTGFTPTYSCYQDPNSAGSSTPDGNYNITCEPDFVYDYPPYGYYHIKYESYCRNVGDNSVYTTGDVDMDNTERKQETTIDIGADEVACEDTYNENGVDWNYDGIVNLKEFAMFSGAWLSHDPNDPAWLADPNLADPNLSEDWYEWKYICNIDNTGDSQYTVDLADFIEFLPDWLWEACWHTDYLELLSSGPGGAQAMMSMPLMEFSMESLSVAPVEEEQAVITGPSIPADTQAQTISEILSFIDEVIEEDPKNTDSLLELESVLETELENLIITLEMQEKQASSQ